MDLFAKLIFVKDQSREPWRPIWLVVLVSASPSLFFSVACFPSATPRPPPPMHRRAPGRRQITPDTKMPPELAKCLVWLVIVTLVALLSYGGFLDVVAWPALFSVAHRHSTGLFVEIAVFLYFFHFDCPIYWSITGGRGRSSSWGWRWRRSSQQCSCSAAWGRSGDWRPERCRPGRWRFSWRWGAKKGKLFFAIKHVQAADPMGVGVVRARARWLPPSGPWVVPLINPSNPQLMSCLFPFWWEIEGSDNPSNPQLDCCGFALSVQCQSVHWIGCWQN